MTYINPQVLREVKDRINRGVPGWMIRDFLLFRGYGKQEAQTVIDVVRDEVSTDAVNPPYTRI